MASSRIAMPPPPVEMALLEMIVLRNDQYRVRFEWQKVDRPASNGAGIPVAKSRIYKVVDRNASSGAHRVIILNRAIVEPGNRGFSINTRR